MKKLFLILFLTCLCINTYNAFNSKNCLKDKVLTDLNSKNLYAYLEENNLLNKINKVCSKDICKDIHFSNLKEDIEMFIKKNIDYLKVKNEDEALDADLKGFSIERILITSCD